MKITSLILSVFAIILTFAFTEMFSLYHFCDIPTLLTALYLLAIFSIFEYFLISITYVIRKSLKKETIGIKKIGGLTLLFIALLLILLFIIVIDIDWLNWYSYSSSFYLNIITRSIEFILPSIILIVLSIILLKKENKKKKYNTYVNVKIF